MPQDIFDWLSHLEFFGVKLGLQQTRRLFDELGSPEQKLKFIHIAGSNGKGSTGAMIDAGLRGVGFRTGFYSSPHLVDVCERWRVNGEVVSREIAARSLEKVRAAAERMRKDNMKVTYFEATTAAAALIFAEANADFVIWETGMGGRLDATNIVTPLVSVITSISLEHKEYLGDTLAKIAFEKAGIIKPFFPVFTGCTIPEEAMEVIREKAEESDSWLYTAHRCDDVQIRFEDDIPYQTFDHGRITLSLPGQFQRANAALAVMVLDYLAGQIPFDAEKALNGLKKAQWPARFQVFPHENMLFDGAHNPECAGVLADALREVYPNEKFDFIYGSFADKDTELFLQQIAPLASSFTFVPVESQRESRSPEELCRMISGIPCKCSTLAAALEEKMPHRKVLCGSLHLCGEALAIREKQNYRSSSY